MNKQDVAIKTLSYFDEGYACSQSVLLAFSDQFGLDEKTAKLISSTFGGGMGRLREKCGAITGGFMVLGLKYGNTDPKDMDAKIGSYKKVRQLNKQVEEIHGATNCSELLKKHSTPNDINERKRHKVICRQLVGNVTELTYDMIQQDNVQ